MTAITSIPCPVCEGSGLYTAEEPTCPQCNGKGRVWDRDYIAELNRRIEAKDRKIVELEAVIRRTEAMVAEAYSEGLRKGKEALR